jgi:O-antigen/teichoic acid export membrane protein
MERIMKTVIIIVLYKTSEEEIKRIKTEINGLNIRNFKLFLIDNTNDNRGYAYGLNKGIKQAKKFNPDYYVFANPDISFRDLKGKNIFEASKYFDIWGFSLKQDKRTYYGGKIDKLRMSGGLKLKSPIKRFIGCDFVSGSLMCVKKTVVDKVGLFNEKYFMYYEDVDYCYRANKQGFKIGIDSNIKYNHYEVSKQNELKNYLLNSSRKIFLKNYGSLKQKLYEIIRLPKTIIEDKKSFLFNFFSLNFSSVITRLISFILFLIYINNLSLKDFGIYSLVWIHINLLSPFADFGTTTYGIIKKKISSPFISNLFSLRLILSLITIVVTIGAAFLIGFSNYIILLVLIVSPVIISNAVSGTYLIIQSLKNKQYLSSLVSTGFNIVSLIILGFIIFLTKSLLVLFIGISSLYLIYVLINIFLIKREIKLIVIYNLNIWRDILKKSLIFVLITLFAGIYFKLDVYLLNFFKGVNDVAIYSAGYRFFEAFLFLASSYSFSALPTLTKLYSYNKTLFLNKIKKDSIFLGSIGIIVSIVCILFSSIVLNYFLKINYAESVKVFNIVILSLPVILLTTILFNALYVIKKTKVVLGIFAFQTVLNFILNYMYIPKYSYIASSYITLLSELINMILAVYLFVRLFNYENRN